MPSASSQVTIPFRSELEVSKPSITITGHPCITDGTQGIPLRVYPTGCTFAATQGTITQDISRQVTVDGEMMQWNGNTGRLKFQCLTPPTAQMMFGFDEQGRNVNPATVTFTVNTQTGVITSSKSFQGLVKVGPYTSVYQLIWYRPITELDNIQPNRAPTVHVNYGVIAAYKDGAMAIHQVQIPTQVGINTDKLELWKVTSKIISDADGTWEYPTNWTTNYSGTYTTGQTGPDKDQSLVVERVHEIGYVTKTGGVMWYESFLHTLQKPYNTQPTIIQSSGTPQFQPSVAISFNAASSLFPDDAAAQAAANYYIAQRNLLPLIRR